MTSNIYRFYNNKLLTYYRLHKSLFRRSRVARPSSNQRSSSWRRRSRHSSSSRPSNWPSSTPSSKPRRRRLVSRSPRPPQSCKTRKLHIRFVDVCSVFLLFIFFFEFKVFFNTFPLTTWKYNPSFVSCV